MRELVASALVAAFLSAGCGPLITRTTVAAPEATGAERAAVFRQAALKFQGKPVTVKTTTGERIWGRVGEVGETAVLIQTPRRTYDSFGNRLSKPAPGGPVEVPYSAMQSIKRQVSLGSWVWVGIGVLNLVIVIGCGEGGCT